MDETRYEIEIDHGAPVVLADYDRASAEAEASRYRHSLYPGSRITLYAVTRVVIDDGAAVNE